MNICDINNFEEVFCLDSCSPQLDSLIFATENTQKVSILFNNGWHTYNTNIEPGNTIPIRGLNENYVHIVRITENVDRYFKITINQNTNI